MKLPMAIEALAAVISFRPDIIILDLGLPDIDGVEVTPPCENGPKSIIVVVREQEQRKLRPGCGG
jgi:DNA-binding response OmpR family regulator